MKKRVAFRRAMKQQCELAMQAGAKGVKVICSGRLGGAEMARKETQMEGSIPLHTIDADVDYAAVDARTTYGIIGIKVWIYKGKYGTRLEPDPNVKRTLHRPRSVKRTPRAAAANAGANKAPAESKPQQAPESGSAAAPEKKTE
jgi:ribosomal protein S3